MATTPTRVDLTLFEAAKAHGALHSRSAAQQIDHWARIGREVEASPAVTHDQVARVLAGQTSYDELSFGDQAAARASWDEAIAERLAGLNLEPELIAAGAPWAEGDADGNAVIRGAET